MSLRSRRQAILGGRRQQRCWRWRVVLRGWLPGQRRNGVGREGATATEDGLRPSRREARMVQAYKMAQGSLERVVKSMAASSWGG